MNSFTILYIRLIQVSDCDWIPVETEVKVDSFLGLSETLKEIIMTEQESGHHIPEFALPSVYTQIPHMYKARVEYTWNAELKLIEEIRLNVSRYNPNYYKGLPPIIANVE